MKASRTLDCKFPSLYSLHFTLGRHSRFCVPLRLPSKRKIFWNYWRNRTLWSPLLLQPTLTVRKLR